MRKKVIVSVLFAVMPMLTLLPYNARAGLSWFSRANCGVELPPIPWVGIFANESLTWNQFDGTDRWLRTATVHNVGGYALENGSNWNQMHYERVDWDHTWRSYAGDIHHLTYWWVHGVHYYLDDGNGVLWFLGYTYATHCNITQW